jgi:uncharacterized membrane protein
MSALPFSTLDLFAVVLFLALWIGYTFFADALTLKRPSLFSAMQHYRLMWMRRMLERDNRIVDSSILRNLLSGSNFFASTTMLILGGLIALLASAAKAVDVVASLPYTQLQTERALEYKILLEIAIFIYAFFKFTWSMRQFNFVSVMVGAAPSNDKPDEFDAFISRCANVAQLAGEDNNRGLRAYYFGLAALTWFFHPLAMIGFTIIVIGVLYYREFMSRTMRALTENLLIKL